LGSRRTSHHFKLLLQPYKLRLHARPLPQCSYSSRSASTSPPPSTVPALDVGGRQAIWPAHTHAVEEARGVEFTQGDKRVFDRSRAHVCRQVYALWTGPCWSRGDPGISSCQWLQLRALTESPHHPADRLEEGVSPRRAWHTHLSRSINPERSICPLVKSST